MTWLQIISYIAIIIGILQVMIIVIDEIRRPQMMMIMNVVWPMMGLYFPLFGIWFYYRIGRMNGKMDMSKEMNMEAAMEMDMDMKEEADESHMEHHHHRKKPFWQSVFLSTTHCSGGCALGDIIGAPLVFAMGWTITGNTLFADYVVEFILAYLFGIAFQYYGMGFKHDNPKQALINAIKADTLSLVAFEIGMFGWMAIVHYLFVNVPQPNTSIFWFMMQLAMILGFCTSYPMNWYLVKSGIKHGM